MADERPGFESAAVPLRPIGPIPFFQRYLLVSSQEQSGASPAPVRGPHGSPPPPPPPGAILRYDGNTGAFIDIFVNAVTILGLAIGPDGNLYAANELENNVLRFDGRTGAPMGPFASGGKLKGLGDNACNLVFGPDNNLYVSSSGAEAVLKFDGTSGSYLGVFARLPRSSYPRGLVFGPDRNLYVVTYNDASVLRFDGSTGASLGVFVASGLGGLATPSDLAFGPDGNLYISGGPGGAEVGIYRFDVATGAIALFASVFAAYAGAYPFDLIFGPDNNLYVTVQGEMNGVLRFDGETGAFIDQFVPNGSGGLGGAFGLTFQTVEIELEALAIQST